MQGLGAQAGATDFLGPSLKVEVQAALMDEDDLLRAPEVLEGRTLTILLMDFSAEIATFLLDSKEGQHDVTSFDFLEVCVVPQLGELVTKAQLWARGSDEVLERIQYYSADEVPVTLQAAPKRTPGQVVVHKEEILGQSQSES